MESYGDTWAIVLAGGEGRRLHSLTTTLSGVAVPKQYCSMWGGPSLLEDALIRAASVAPLHRICAVVAASHRRWWSTSMAPHPNDNVIVQPRNRGTGIGILLALLKVLDRDPYANVILLPADHYLENESVMAAALQQVADLAAMDTEAVYLLGAEGSEPDPELGYIVPKDSRRGSASGVRQFFEKPSRVEASLLLAQGALVNVFIIAGSVGALLGLYQSSHANAVAVLSEALRPQGGTPAQLSAAYEQLTPVDLSRDILASQAELLRVLSVPKCGWTDLGTPECLAEALKTVPRKGASRTTRSGSITYLNLATQWLARG